MHQYPVLVFCFRFLHSEEIVFYLFFNTITLSKNLIGYYKKNIISLSFIQIILFNEIRSRDACLLCCFYIKNYFKKDLKIYRHIYIVKFSIFNTVLYPTSVII